MSTTSHHYNGDLNAVYWTALHCTDVITKNTQKYKLRHLCKIYFPKATQPEGPQSPLGPMLPLAPTIPEAPAGNWACWALTAASAAAWAARAWRTKSSKSLLDQVGRLTAVWPEGEAGAGPAPQKG